MYSLYSLYSSICRQCNHHYVYRRASSSLYVNPRCLSCRISPHGTTLWQPGYVHNEPGLAFTIWFSGCVEGLYCKRPIQCLASSKILTFPPPHHPASVYTPRFWCGGRTHTLGGKGVGGQYFGRHQTLLCTLLYKCKYFVSSWHIFHPIPCSLYCTSNAMYRTLFFVHCIIPYNFFSSCNVC